jgi:predicted unusual protein kinase regulating ubiquinone biosynthesis (AarF/ABC1/UbiB family)
MPFEKFVASASQEARNRGGNALYEFYVGSVYRYGMFNGDPHPGNLLFHDDGALTVLDYGCVREFDRNMVRALALLSRAVRADDPHAIRRALSEIGAAEPDDRAMPVTRQLLRGFFGPVLVKGPHRVESGLSLDTKELMKDKLAVARMRLPPKLMFLFRIRFGLHSELVRLRSVGDWAALEEELSSAA